MIPGLIIWKDVKESLPEFGKIILIYVVDGLNHYNDVVVGRLVHKYGSANDTEWHYLSNYWGIPVDGSRVVAWTYLPEPPPNNIDKFRINIEYGYD